MKRYILLLALISMQANVTLPIFDNLRSKVSTFIGSFRNNVTSPDRMWGSFKSNFKSSFASRMNTVFGFFKFRTAQAEELVENKIERPKIFDRWEEEYDRAEAVKSFENRLATVAGNDLNEEQLDGYYVVKNHCSERIVQFFNTFPELLKGKSNRETNTELEGAKCLSDFARVLMRERTRQFENNFNGLYQKTFWTYMSGQPGSLSILFKDHIKNSVFKELQRETKEVWQKDLEEDFKKHQAKS